MYVINEKLNKQMNKQTPKQTTTTKKTTTTTKSVFYTNAITTVYNICSITYVVLAHTHIDPSVKCT